MSDIILSGADSDTGTKQWLNGAVGYEVYVRSFADSNGDGIGDIAGITGRLDYLKWLGVDIVWVTERAGDLGPFIRSLVGLDRAAATEAFAAYLDESRFSVEQVRFVTLIVDELTANGLMEPARLYESPYIDHAPTGPDYLFPDTQVDAIVDILREVKATALGPGAA